MRAGICRTITREQILGIENVISLPGSISLLLVSCLRCPLIASNSPFQPTHLLYILPLRKRKGPRNHVPRHHLPNGRALNMWASQFC